MKTLLPIDEVRNEIIEAAESYQVLVISAETGAGKSTRVPEMLMEEGYEVVVTEPRRVAAVSLAERVSEELNVELGTIVGYATGFEKAYTDCTKILYATDGLQLIRELNMRATSEKSALILDEVHEMNLNMETLIAWSKKMIEEDGSFTKLIIMSATIDSEKIANYFGKDITKVINVPGTLFEVSMEEKPKALLEVEIKKAIALGENTLVFLPGKREIEEMQYELAEFKAEILPLHGELAYSEQKKCFLKYNVPKVILATNVAQTSITVPDIDCVIDSGSERSVETRDGIEGLFLTPCSQSDILQRKGRAGRTHEGRYVLCSDIPFEKREKAKRPEIYRLSLEQVVLKLASAKIDASSIRFLHQPPKEAIDTAKSLLISLGALDSNLNLTDIGRKMAKMPVSARQARMLVEAEKEGGMRQMIIIAAILQNGSLITKDGDYRDILGYSFNIKSDLIAEMKVYEYITENAPVDFKELCVNSKTYFRVKEYVKKLNDMLESELENDFDVDSGTLIKLAFSAMKDLVFFNEYRGYVSPEEIFKGVVVKNSTCYYSSEIVFGFPKKIEINGRYGKDVLNLITLCTRISRLELNEWASEFFVAKTSEPEYKSYFYTECLVQRVSYSYRGYVFYSEEIELDDPQLFEIKKKEYEEEKEKEHIKWLSENAVKVGNIWQTVYYNYFQPYIFVTRQMLDDSTLPLEYEFKGKKVMLRDENTEATAENLDALREKVLKIALDFKIQSLVGSKERISGSKQIMEAIKTSCETTVTVEMAGKTLSGKIYKYVDVESSGMYLVVSSQKVEASEKVVEALKAIFKAEAEKKFNENVFFFVIKGKRELTNKGSKALSYYRDEKLMVISQLTLESYDDSMEYLSIAYEEAKAMLG
ncbi:MAG: ATP-dependent RNA helicase [Clostridia bacterium]|nr:ATP-dependent RNA helicase [Clostridia bacterium]